MPMPTSEEFHIYATFPEQIAAAVAELTPEQLLAIPAPGSWSVQQVLIHLADSEVIGYERLRRIIAEDYPPLQPYDEEAWGNNLYYHQQDPQLALALFSLLRQASAALLKQLPADTWERKGLHAANGEIDLYASFLAYLNHGKSHLQQIEQALQQIAISEND